MKILVAGGAGFLGSHMVDALLQQGHKVVVLDSMVTGRRENLKHALKHPNFMHLLDGVSCDICFDHWREGWTLEEPFDVVYNFACAASPKAYQKDPLHTMLTCTLGTHRLLDLAHKWKATYIQASTSEVYGDPDKHPQVETYLGRVNCTGPRACYDEGKRSAEALCFDWHRKFGVPIKVVRIFNTYGPRMAPDDGRVVSNFLCQVLRGENITVYGNGNQTRSFCYVDDLIRGFTLVRDTPKTFTGPVNLGNPNEFTIGRLANMAMEVVGKGVHVTYCPLPQDDPRVRCPDISLAKSTFGWEPHMELREGLELTAAYFRGRV